MWEWQPVATLQVLAKDDGTAALCGGCLFAAGIVTAGYAAAVGCCNMSKLRQPMACKEVQCVL